MKYYKFFDHDETPYREYDLSGKEYRDLIGLCFRYSDVLSFINCSPDKRIVKLIENDHISRPDYIRTDNSLYGYGYLNDDEIGLRFYRLGSEIMEMMLSETGSIFDWISGRGFNNPEDPVFYRKDGSIFFSSVIHEGEITLSVNDDEDVSSIISNAGWKEVSDFNYHGFCY